MSDLLPFGPDREDLRASVVGLMVAKAGGLTKPGGAPLAVEDLGLVPRPGARGRGGPQHWRAWKAMLGARTDAERAADAAKAQV